MSPIVYAVPSADGKLVLVDAAQAFRPRLWPAFLPPFHVWMHIVLTLQEPAHSNG